MVHLTTVVGGSLTTFRRMLQHYADMGVTSFLVNVHLRWPSDPILDEARQIAAELGISIHSTTVGRWQDVIRNIYARSRSAYPRDWHVLADQDEFQQYPLGLRETIKLCEREDYDYVQGCFIDRIAQGGRLEPIRPDVSLFRQFPIGAFLTYPLAGADARKVVLVRGHVDLTQGQHRALSGNPCPHSKTFVPVHHFKWVYGIRERLLERVQVLKADKRPHVLESERIVAHLKENNGCIDLSRPDFLAADCGSGYPHWELVKTWFATASQFHQLSDRLFLGPSHLGDWAEELGRFAQALTFLRPLYDVDQSVAVIARTTGHKKNFSAGG